MFDKITKISFTVLFLGMLAVPLVTTNLKKNAVSQAENRTLAQMPELYEEDGSPNRNFLSEFETWINDNIGLRSNMVIANAKIQYYIFDVLSNNSDMLLGPNRELNYATSAIITDYQHFDLKSEAKLEEIAKSYQTINDYLESLGIQYYYFQCWDKQSIYPEYFPNTVIQYGDISKTDQVIDTLENKTSVTVVSPKQLLIDNKDMYDTYSVWGDATHWTQRGAYLGYLQLMETINRNNGGKYKILQEEDYVITVTDQGSTLFGGIHEEDYLENFAIKNPQAYQTDEAPIFLSEWAYRSRKVYRNDAVDNDDVLLIIGDSYFDSFLYDDFAESFHCVVQIWGDYMQNLKEIVEYYEPDIIVNENAERCDRTELLIVAAKSLNGEE